MPRRNRQPAQRGLLIICVSGVRWICGRCRVIMNWNREGLGMIDPSLRGGVKSARGIEWMVRTCWWEGQHGFGLSSGVLVLVLVCQLHLTIEKEKPATFSNSDGNHWSPLVLTVPSDTCAVHASLGLGSFDKPSLDDTKVIAPFVEISIIESILRCEQFLLISSTFNTSENDGRRTYIRHDKNLCQLYILLLHSNFH
jgi:hypothetical protein